MRPPGEMILDSSQYNSLPSVAREVFDMKTRRIAREAEPAELLPNISKLRRNQRRNHGGTERNSYRSDSEIGSGSAGKFRSKFAYPALFRGISTDDRHARTPSRSARDEAYAGKFYFGWSLWRHSAAFSAFATFRRVEQFARLPGI